MREAIEDTPFVVVLNAWVAAANLLDAPYWNRKYKYVPEVSEAARSLLELDFVEIYEVPSNQWLDERLLPFDLALAAIDEPENWWMYEPANADYDPEAETLEFSEAELRERATPNAVYYSVYRTDAGLDRFGKAAFREFGRGAVYVSSLGDPGPVDVSGIGIFRRDGT
jgi:hypothetical protein